MFKFQSLSDEQLNPYKPGCYDFKIVGAQLDVSQKGIPCVILELEVNIGMSKPLKIKDWLMSYPSDHEYFLMAVANISSLCKAIYEEGLYKSNEFNPLLLIGKKGRIKLRKGKPKDDGRVFLEKDSYIIPTKAMLEREVAEQNPIFNDDIPFG